MSGETLGKRLIVSIHFNWGWKKEWEKVKKKIFKLHVIRYVIFLCYMLGQSISIIKNKN